MSSTNRTALNRRRYFLDRIEAAGGNPRAQKAEVVRYLRAALDDVPAERVPEVVSGLVRLVDEWIPEGVPA